MSFELRSARYLAADALERTIRPGDRVIDATLGNGHDTCMLAALVGEQGRVYGFDIQPDAVARTRAALQEKGLLDRCELHVVGHEHVAEFVTGPVRAAVFNLGWLPGAQHAVTTLERTTLPAVEAACSLLCPGGIVSVCVYPGHDEGKRELAALDRFAASLSPRAFNVLRHQFMNGPENTPQLLLIQRNG